MAMYKQLFITNNHVPFFYFRQLIVLIVKAFKQYTVIWSRKNFELQDIRNK